MKTFLANFRRTLIPCGENGEFHTFVYDGPMFRQPLAIETGEVRNVDGFIYTDLLCLGACGAL